MRHMGTISMSKRAAPSARRFAPGLLGLAALLVLCLPASAQPAHGDACDQITAACDQAGFVYGAVRSGNGLVVDCIQPIMQGRPQPPEASRPLPPIDPQLVTACHASNPAFGQAAAAAPPPSSGPGSGSAAQPVSPDGGQYLDAKFCGDTLNLNPGSDYDDGSCQLWMFAPGPAGWSRLQLKRNGKFLDAKFCSDEMNMNPGSNFDGGSCQLWRLVPDASGWSRLQIRRNEKFLTAENCSDIMLGDLATGDAAATQLWRFVPDDAGRSWARLQIKCVGSPAPVVAGSDVEYSSNGDSYGWYDDGWDGPGWYIVGFEFRRGFGFGGREGWHNWEHHGSHSHHGHGEPHDGEHHEHHEHQGSEHHDGEHHFGGGGHHFAAAVHRGGGGHGGGGHGGGGHGGGGHGGGGHGGGGHGGGGHGGGGHGRRSDIRLKHDIVLLGHLDNGLGYYRFSYNGSDKAYVGVMAQEVQAVMPEAVVRGSDGYLRVYYDQLGIRMQTWESWVASGERIPTTAPNRQ
jgi:hypothetical protein